MSRARMNGALAGLILAAGVVAGCGGGTTASQSAPGPNATGTETTPATGTTPAPAGQTTTAPKGAADSVISAISAEDPKSPKFKGFGRFPIEDAGTIFVTPATSTTGTTTSGTTGGLIGGTPTVPTTTSAPTTTSSAVRTNSTNIASAEVDGVSQTLKEGAKVPASSPQFTVQSIEETKVVLKLNSGTFPGGSTTIDIAAGASVTLSNPTTGAAIFILVKSITPVAV